VAPQIRQVDENPKSIIDCFWRFAVVKGIVNLARKKEMESLGQSPLPMRKAIVQIIVKKCLGYKKGEELLVVCDDELCELAYAFYQKALSLGVETTYLLIKPRQMHGQEPPRIVAQALKQADLAVLLTSMSLSHTTARKQACKRFGTRIASLPGATKEMLTRAIPIDYSKLKNKVSALACRLTRAKKIEISTANGTHLVMSVKSRKGFSDHGLYTQKGAFGNLPAGEACIGPLEGTTNGRLVVDGSAPFVGKVKRPRVINLKNGYARNIPLTRMRPLVKSLGRGVLNVAELGIGLNPRAKVTGNILEDEKTLKTAHIALGNNKSFGGRVSCPSHLDFVFFNPVIRLDGVKLRSNYGISENYRD